MARVSCFISPAQLPREPYAFRTFQDLSSLVREALAWGTRQQILGCDCDVRDVTNYIVNNYDMNQTKAVGELIQEMDTFIRDVVHCRMVRCYVDHGRNMLAAKLAWHEDY